MDDIEAIIEAIRTQEGARARDRLGLKWTPADSVAVIVDIKLGFFDRLRVFFGRTIYLRSQVWTENPPGATVGETSVTVQPFWERPGPVLSDSPNPKR